MKIQPLALALLAVPVAVALPRVPYTASLPGEAKVTHAVCLVQPTEGNACHGVVHFEQSGDRVKVRAELMGLAPNSRHGFHIHEFGDLTSPDGTSAGGHYNPEGHPHALPEEGERHAGDLGNLEADARGKATMEIEVDNISLDGEHCVLGRAVVVHADPDDGGQPTGNAGARIGCGVIGIAKGGS